MTSELDSESLSTLRKIIFKRDLCKVEVVAAPVITTCAKNSKCQIQNFSEFFRISEFFRTCLKKFEKISEFRKVSEK